MSLVFPLYIRRRVYIILARTPDLWTHLNEVITRYTYLRKDINLYEQITYITHQPVFIYLFFLNIGLLKDSSRFVP